MAHFLSQSWLLNRREALRGLGVLVALPLLECMQPLRADGKDDWPRRSVFIYLVFTGPPSASPKYRPKMHTY